jgi:hypothetical protein
MPPPVCHPFFFLILFTRRECPPSSPRPFVWVPLLEPPPPARNWSRHHHLFPSLVSSTRVAFCSPMGTRLTHPLLSDVAGAPGASPSCSGSHRCCEMLLPTASSWPRLTGEVPPEGACPVHRPCPTGARAIAGVIPHRPMSSRQPHHRARSPRSPHRAVGLGRPGRNSRWAGPTVTCHGPKPPQHCELSFSISFIFQKFD